MQIALREETPADAQAIEAVTVAAFLNAAHASHTEQVIIERLREAGKLTFSLVAEQGGRIIGHAAVSPVSISDGTQDWYGLGPVSVLPDCQGQGTGSRLVRELLDKLRENSASGCVVLGNPGYYQRFGFEARPELALPDVPAEYFMTLSFGPPMPRGTVSYHEAFNV